MKCAKCLDIDFVQEARGCPACDPENYCPHGLTKTRTCGVCERVATVLEIAEKAIALREATRELRRASEQREIFQLSFEEGDKQDILDAMWALLKEGAPE